MEANVINRFKGIYTTIEPILKEYNQQSLIEFIKDLMLRSESNQTSIVVCGEFKRGKSTFINALLNQNICPTDEHIATSSVSVIKYGEKENVHRIYETTEGIKDEQINFSDILKYAKGSDWEIDKTLMLIIEIPNNRLKQGLTIIDTPGVGGLNPRHRYLTLNAMPKADAVFYMVSVGEPVTATELSFFKDSVLRNAKHYKIILNKADELDRERLQSEVEDCKHKFISECQLDKIDVVPVSALLWEEYNISGDEDDKMFSYCDEVEDAIVDICNEYKSSLQPLLKNTMIQGLKILRQTIEEQLSQVVDSNPEKQKQLIERGNLLKKVVHDLKSNESEIKKQIATILRKSQSEVLSDVSKGNILLSTDRLDTILNDDRALGDDGTKWVLNEVNKDIQSLISDVDKKINAGFEKAMSLLKKNIQVTFEMIDGQIAGSLSLQQRKDGEIACGLVRQALPGLSVGGIGAGAAVLTGGLASGIGSAFGGSAIGALVGGIGAALTTLALPIGLIAGAAYIWKSVQNENRLRNIAEMKRKITPRIQMMTTDIQIYISNRYEEFRISIEKYFETEASNLVKQMDDIQRDFQKCQKDSKAVAERRKDLSAKLSLLDTSITQLNVLLNNRFKK